MTELDSSNAEKDALIQVFEEWSNRSLTPENIRKSSDETLAEAILAAGFGRASRDAEVDALREQLAAAEAAVEKVRQIIRDSVKEHVDDGTTVNCIAQAITGVRSVVLAVHDREVAARERDAALKEAEDAAANVPTYKGAYAGALAIRALRSGTEGSGQ